MAWMAAWALVGLSKLTKPKHLLWLVARSMNTLDNHDYDDDDDGDDDDVDDDDDDALVGGAVDEHLGADHVAEGEEHLHQLGVAKLLGGDY